MFRSGLNRDKLDLLKSDLASYRGFGRGSMCLQVRAQLQREVAQCHVTLMNHHESPWPGLVHSPSWIQPGQRSQTIDVTRWLPRKVFCLHRYVARTESYECVVSVIFPTSRRTFCAFARASFVCSDQIHLFNDFFVMVVANLRQVILKLSGPRVRSRRNRRDD
jgi:hypothetical protein